MTQDIQQIITRVMAGDLLAAHELHERMAEVEDLALALRAAELLVNALDHLAPIASAALVQRAEQVRQLRALRCGRW